MASPNNYLVDRKTPGIPGNENKGVEVERVPEIARYLDQQKKLIDELWVAIGKTENILSPILRSQPPKGTEEAAAGRIEPLTHIGGVIDENNRSINNMILTLAAIHKRIEI